MDEAGIAKPGPSKLLVGALVAALGLAAGFAFLWSAEQGADPEDVDVFLRSRSNAASEAASEVIATLLTYDSDSVGDRQDDLLPLATGGFREQYEELLDQGLGDVLRRTSATSTGEIVDEAEVGFLSATTASAVMRVVQEVTSDEVPEGRQIFYVMKLELVAEGDRWLADELEILSQQQIEI